MVFGRLVPPDAVPMVGGIGYVPRSLGLGEETLKYGTRQILALDGCCPHGGDGWLTLRSLRLGKESLKYKQEKSVLWMPDSHAVSMVSTTG